MINGMNTAQAFVWLRDRGYVEPQFGPLRKSGPWLLTHAPSPADFRGWLVAFCVLAQANTFTDAFDGDGKPFLDEISFSGGFTG
jgi:hypothetical protein